MFYAPYDARLLSSSVQRTVKAGMDVETYDDVGVWLRDSFPTIFEDVLLGRSELEVLTQGYA
jgi:hypothetical protein